MFYVYMLLILIAIGVILGFHQIEKVLLRIEEELKRMNEALRKN